MKISIISGHLTATNKTHIKLMFENGLNCAKVNRINYDIIPETGFYSVIIVQTDKSCTSGFIKSKATFKIN